jgi:hypothetical protein
MASAASKAVSGSKVVSTWPGPDSCSIDRSGSPSSSSRRASGSVTGATVS